MHELDRQNYEGALVRVTARITEAQKIEREAREEILALVKCEEQYLHEGANEVAGLMRARIDAQYGIVKWMQELVVSLRPRQEELATILEGAKA